MIASSVWLMLLWALQSPVMIQEDPWARMERLLRPGDQLIVERPGHPATTGRLVSIDAVRIAVWLEGRAFEIARSEVLRVTRLRQTPSGRAVLIGALIGGGIGAGLAYSEQDFDEWGRLLITAIGAGAGAGLGVLAGRRTTPEIVYSRQR